MLSKYAKRGVTKANHCWRCGGKGYNEVSAAAARGAPFGTDFTPACAVCKGTGKDPTKIKRRTR